MANLPDETIDTIFSLKRQLWQLISQPPWRLPTIIPKGFSGRGKGGQDLRGSNARETRASACFCLQNIAFAVR